MYCQLDVAVTMCQLFESLVTVSLLLFKYIFRFPAVGNLAVMQLLQHVMLIIYLFVPVIDGRAGLK